jgi:hypothetical protein
VRLGTRAAAGGTGLIAASSVSYALARLGACLQVDVDRDQSAGLVYAVMRDLAAGR